MTSDPLIGEQLSPVQVIKKPCGAPKCALKARHAKGFTEKHLFFGRLFENRKTVAAQRLHDFTGGFVITDINTTKASGTTCRLASHSMQRSVHFSNRKTKRLR
jgi:hypothetical protein